MKFDFKLSFTRALFATVIAGLLISAIDMVSSRKYTILGKCRNQSGYYDIMYIDTQEKDTICRYNLDWDQVDSIQYSNY